MPLQKQTKTTIVCIVIIALVIITIGLVYIRSLKPPPDVTVDSFVDKSQSQAAVTTSNIIQPDEGPALRPDSNTNKKPTGIKSKGVLIFVIDDAGHNIHQLEAFTRLPFPVTIAVLPSLAYTEQAAALVKASGKELILHQPMEAIGHLDPGPSAIYTSMSDEQIRHIIRQNLNQLSGAIGMNNHMGSKATSDVRVMTIVLDEVANAGIYFLDSFTISDSVAYYVASLMRQTIWERSVFVDNNPDKDSIVHYIQEGTKIAEKRGYAIMIGHVWSASLAQTLSDLYPSLIEQGYTMSTISRIMMTDTYEDTRD